uniref:ORF1 n=1 Tax=Carrot torradovirus 1 TaxID=1425364 RepID=A0A3T1BA26_9SECO|nr:ORF1 [Carrot torradovirus 1]
MSFINSLDIGKEETEFQQTISRSKFKCVVSTEKLSLSARTALDFRRVTEEGTQFSLLRVEWKHSFPQPFGFHVLSSGNWNVSEVRFSGALVRKACRLHTVEKVLEENKEKFSTRESYKKLEKAFAILKSDLEYEQDRANKAEAKLKKLLEEIATAKEQAAVASIEPAPKVQAEASTSSDGISNDSLFKSWADSGNAD